MYFAFIQLKSHFTRWNVHDFLEIFEMLMQRKGIFVRCKPLLRIRFKCQMEQSLPHLSLSYGPWSLQTIFTIFPTEASSNEILLLLETEYQLFQLKS